MQHRFQRGKATSRVPKNGPRVFRSASQDQATGSAKVVGQLVTDSDTPERKINVDVENGIVTLRGTVETMQQKQEAERIAKQTEGVKRVNNMLKVSRT